jgi:hypothetical protein
MASMGNFKHFVAAPVLVLSVLAAAPSARAQEHDTQPKVSVALERAAGVSYTKVFAKDSDNSASLTVFNLGGVTVNPYASPRIGVDVILDQGLTLGAGFSIGRYSISGTVVSTTTTTGPTGTSTSTTSTSQDLGSLFIYTITPRVGYRIPVSPEFDITPRGGLTLAGGSVSSGSSSDSAGVFALALSAEGVGAYRITKSFNALAGLGFDYTVTASASASNGSGSSTSTDIKGGLWALQLWLGLGGYF